MDPTPVFYDPDREEVEEDERDVERQLEEIKAYERLYDHDRSWERLREDADGRLIAGDGLAEQRRRRRQMQVALGGKRVRRGLIRYVTVVLDLSAEAHNTDLRPSRLGAALQALVIFVRAFFDANPLSQMAILATTEGRALTISPMDSSPETHISALRQVRTASGQPSFGASLELATSILSQSPPYGFRECILLPLSLLSVDKNDIESTIAQAAAQRVHVSATGIGGELRVLRHACTVTRGQYFIARDEAHLGELLELHMRPPATARGDVPPKLVHMGFAEGARRDARPGFVGADRALTSGGFTCPRCYSTLRSLSSSTSTSLSRSSIIYSFICFVLFPQRLRVMCPRSATRAICY